MSDARTTAWHLLKAATNSSDERSTDRERWNTPAPATGPCRRRHGRMAGRAPSEEVAAMNDETKAAIEWLRKLRDDARGVWEPKHPTRKQRFLDISPDEAEVLMAHIDSEPARLAAAREEQREACAQSCPVCKGAGFTMRVRECPYCSDSTHDHICPTDMVRVGCLCGVERIRATPITSTPLGDEIRDEREVSDSLRTQLIAAEARVKELEEEQEDRDDVTVAEQRLKFWEENPHACPVHFGARTACGQCLGSVKAERDTLKAKLDAVRAAVRDNGTMRFELSTNGCQHDGYAQMNATRERREPYYYGECLAHDGAQATEDELRARVLAVLDAP